MSIRVVELFAGVGGFRIGLEGFEGKSASSNYEKVYNSSYKVIWSNQWEPSSKKPGDRQEANMVYNYRWENTEKSIHNNEDLNSSANPEMSDQIVRKNIPEHDLLVGGFPCQDYSVAGVNTKGLEGKKGVLWWNIHKILKARKPKYLFLENVDRLLKSPTNDRGRDFAIMLSTLWKLGYDVEWKVINAADYGMPQRRRRVFILAYHKDSKIKIKNIKKWCLNDGVFAKSFPSTPKNAKEIEISRNPTEITKSFGDGKFLNAGVMKKGKIYMSDFKANKVDYEKYSKKYRLLGDVLIEDENSIEDSFFLNKKTILKKPIEKIQLDGFELDQSLERRGKKVLLETEYDKWVYLKGRKAEERKSSKGIFFYKEGPLSLTDSLEKPSRTIITSEGGPGASRFKHLIKKNGKLRRLVPKELERLNMFPDNHTSIGIDSDNEVKISASKRAFFMGNALVVGVVEKVSKELFKQITNG
jgi:DNA (cytosine-5)-methyltransferase 1